MKLLQLNKISPEAVDSVSDSFNRLPHTNHKDGAYRLRRYSVIELRTTFWNAKEEAEITHLPIKHFTQSEDYNKHQGGMKRDFENIEEETLQSVGLKEICLAFKRAFNLIDGQRIDIHQLRVITLENSLPNTTPVAPEGIHQDGFAYIAMIGINRFNIKGGELLVYTNKDKDSTPFVDKELRNGEIIMIKDDYFWHNARDIWAANDDNQGFGDWFILCAKN